MELTTLESFLNWSEEPDGEFPELQYSLSERDNFNWDEILDQYLDPSPLVAVNPTLEGPESSLDLLGVSCIQEYPVGQVIEELPELSPSPKLENGDIYHLRESLSRLQEHVDVLENRLSQKEKWASSPPNFSTTTNKTRKIEALETYLDSLQPFLQQLCNSIGEIQTRSVA